MKNLLKIMAYGTLVIYFLFTFAEWQLYPGEWSTGSRGGFGITSFIFYFYAFLMTAQHEPKKDKK